VKLRRSIVATAVATAMIVGAAVVLSYLSTNSGNSLAQNLFSGPTTTRPAATSAGQQRATGHAASPSAPTSSPHTTGKKSQAQDDSLLSAEQPGGATATPYALPHPTMPPRTISTAAVAVVAPDSKVSSKSVSKASESTQVLLSATTTLAPGATLAYLQQRFTSLGMTGTPLPAVGGATGIAFTRGPDTVTITVSAHRKGSSYLIHGVLRTGA